MAEAVSWRVGGGGAFDEREDEQDSAPRPMNMHPSLAETEHVSNVCRVVT